SSETLLLVIVDCDSVGRGRGGNTTCERVTHLNVTIVNSQRVVSLPRVLVERARTESLLIYRPVIEAQHHLELKIPGVVAVGRDPQLDPATGNLGARHRVAFAWHIKDANRVVVELLPLNVQIGSLFLAGLIDPDLEPGVVVLVVVQSIERWLHALEKWVRS